MRTSIIRFMTILALAMTSGAWAGTFVTAVDADATPPVFATPPAPQSVTASSAVITWSSDKAADSRVYFGEAQSLVKVAGEIEYATTHSVTLTKLQPNTTYSYQVVSVDPMGNQTTSATLSFTTNAKVNQTISFGAAPAIVVGGTGTVSATATSGLAVAFSSTTTSVCTTSGSTVTSVAAGICTIAANQAGDANYNAAAQVTQDITITIGKTTQTVNFGTAPTLAVGGTGTVSANASSGLAVSFSSATPSVCTVNGSTVTGVATGTCTIVANQAGNATYNAATQVNQTITVGKANQTISFGTAPTVVVGGTGTVTATGGASGNAVTFSSSTASVCTVSGSIVTGVTAGTCSIAANQAGNLNYNAAIQANQTITIGSKLINVDLVPSWNLVGNSVNAPLDVATVFGDATKVTTAWKWISATSKWAFYTPSMTVPDLAAYAATKGYEVLTTINGGEGFWVNSKAAFTVQLPAGTAVATASFQDQPDPALNKMLKGWNLIAMSDNVTPSVFNQGLSVTTPATGVIPLNVTTLWAWDSVQSNWYFYAPSLEVNGGLANYITTKGYLDFTVAGKVLGQGVGFWVNKP